MMPSDRKFMQRRRSLQLEQSRYNSCVEQSRVFRIKELNAEVKKLKSLRVVLEQKAAQSSTVLSETEIQEVENDPDFMSLENLRAWSITNYGIVMQRAKTCHNYKNHREMSGLYGIAEESTTADQCPTRELPTTAPAFDTEQRGTGGAHADTTHGDLKREKGENVGRVSESTFKQRLKAEVKRTDALEKRFEDLERRLIENKKSMEQKHQAEHQSGAPDSLSTNSKETATKGDQSSCNFTNLMYYRTSSGRVLIPNPVDYTAIQSINKLPPSTIKPISRIKSTSF